jgi:2-iminobutanoate/2-iminopropanoate deaminase
MERTIITTDKAPAAGGRYSQGVKVGPFLYTAGQLPIDPATRKMIAGDVAAQTERVLMNLQGIIEAAGGTMKDVVRVTVYITDMSNWGTVNDVYSRFFTDEPPTRCVVGVKELHFGAALEADAIAFIRE